MKTRILFLLLTLLSLPLYAQKINNQIVGTWEVWIPGAVTYLAKDDAVYQKYTPGSPMNSLAIKSDGKFQWGDHAGKLEAVKPWYADPEKTYYRVLDKRNNSYDFWYKKETDQLIFLFGEVGGHAATGTRIGGTQSKQQPSKDQTTTTASRKNNPEKAVNTTSVSFKKNDHVMIEWSGAWYKGTVLEVKDGQYKVHYTGWGSTYDEWVPASRLKASTN